MSNLGIFVQLMFLATAIAYDLGIKHNYRYETTVLVSEGCDDEEMKDPVGHRLSADVHLTSIWQDTKDPMQKLIKIQVSETTLLVPKKSSFEEKKTDLQEVSKHVSYILLKNNRVEKFWDDPDENSAIRNLKRSVASLLQVSRKDGDEKLLDVSGTCGVFYKVEGSTVRRRKGTCRHPLQDTLSSQPFGVRSMSVEQSTGIDCDLQDAASSVVTKCLATERVKSFSNLWKKSSICIHSTTLLILKDTAESKEAVEIADYNSVIERIKKNADKLAEGNMFAVLKNEEELPKSNVVEATKSFRESIKTSNLAKLKSVSAFFKMLPAYRAASKDDILTVLKNKKFTAILPQILDLLAASSTSSSVDAVLSFFEGEKEYNTALERYLISLAVTPKPEAFILHQIKSFLEKGSHHEKIEATLITTLGALVRSYAKKGDKVETKVVDEVLEYLEGALNKCKTDSCILPYLRGLRNAAQSNSIPLLLVYATKGGKPALESLLALKNIPLQQLSQEILEKLLNVFHQVGGKQDRSSRAIAAEILLKKNTGENVLKSILGSLSDQSDAEFSTFVASKALYLMEENQELRSRILRILPEKEIAHYYSLSQKGKSSLFKRQLIGADGLNVTYGIEMELLQGGLLKRSAFDVEFQTENEVSNFLSVGMFAQGLGSFAGGDSSSDDEDSSPSAGMELSLLGASLRPYTFFSSTSELMGHAWSGTASEPTPALQGIFSLSDDHRLVVLHNGMAVRLDLRGAMSADLSASVQISLWSRNSQSQVKNAAALLVRGSAVVDAEIVRSRGEYLFYGQSSIDFSTDLEFSETPFKMCLQMEQPDVQVRHDFQKSVEVTETKYSIKKTKKRKRFIPSRSFALHQTNNELCRIMKSDFY